MEHVPATISRRKLALGAPVAAALAPFAPLAQLAKLAPVGAVAALGTVHNGAVAEPVLDLDLDLDLDDAPNVVGTTPLPVTNKKEFRAAYRLVRGDIHESIVQAMYVSYNPYPCNTPHPREHNFLSVHHDRIDNFFKGLNANQQESLRSIAKTELEFYYSKSFYGTAKSASAGTYKNMISYIKEKGVSDTLNNIRQHHQRDWHNMVCFARFIFNKSEFEIFNTKMVADEKKSDERHLVNWWPFGVTPAKDRVEYKPHYIYRSDDERIVKIGNIRKTVERVELVRTNSFFSAIFFGARYDETSVIQHGVNATNIEAAPTKYSSVAYAIKREQDEGGDYYADADIDKNGPIEGSTDQESRRLMKAGILLVSRETGYVYESYIITQLILRAIGQAVICLTRRALVNGTIDLAKLAETLALEAMRLPEVTEALSVFTPANRVIHENRVKLAITLLISVTSASLILALVVIREAHAVHKENEGKNISSIAENAQVLIRVTATFGTTQTLVQLTALGVLGYVALSRNECAERVRLYVGPAFAASDFIGGIADIVSVVRAGKASTPEGVVLITAGAFRLFGAFVTAADGFYKIATWSYQAIPYVGSILKPLVVNTYTSGTASSLYFIAATIVGVTAVLGSL